MRAAKFFLPLLIASPAGAGGPNLPVHGVRSLERGGALIAGADDADALWLDPAGLAHLAGDRKQALLFDVSLVYQAVEYTGVDPATGLPLPTLTNLQPGTLVPTIAGAIGVGDRLVLAGGLASPDRTFHRYAADGSQRYASVSLAGSREMMVTAGIGYKVDSRLRLGAMLSTFVTHTQLEVVASGCPATITCAAGDRSFDLGLALDQTDALSPSGSLGVQYDATRALTVGLVLETPRRVSATGTLAVELPGAVVFQDATVTGDRATLAFEVPAAVRTGVEWRPTRTLRIEAALAIELWSMHDEVTLTPDGIVIDGVAGGPLVLGKMTIPRDYRTAYAPALGVEWHGPKLMLGAGYAYETAAAPASTVSVLAPDAAKHLIGIGGGYEDAGWQIGAAAGFVALEGVDVSLDNAKVPQLAPLGNATATNVNAGAYRSRYVMVGLRFARAW